MDYPKYLLVKLGEEASEVTKEALKCAIFNPHNYEPGTKVRNDKKLSDELHDMYGVLELLVENGVVTYDFDREKIEAKKKKVIHYAKVMGYLPGDTDEYDQSGTPQWVPPVQGGKALLPYGHLL